LALAVGDLVVYASHGIGRVAVRHSRALDGEVEDVVVLELPQGLSVTLPIERALETLRPLSNEAEIARIQRALRDAESPSEISWQKRFNATREKVSAGDAVGLAEVVRDGVHREQRSAAREGTLPSQSERHLYLKARELLAREVGAARGIDPAEADAWIIDQIGQVPPTSRTADT
jgi:RNA polymerase-interacting CarD/CdnL/TRCF family regulator